MSSSHGLRSVISEAWIQWHASVLVTAALSLDDVTLSKSPNACIFCDVSPGVFIQRREGKRWGEERNEYPFASSFPKCLQWLELG